MNIRVGGQTWVFCCGMMRSGSTLQYQLVTAIVSALGIGRGLGIHDAASFPQLFRQYQDECAIFVIKIHDFVDAAPALHAAGRAKILYIYRDIRDVVASWMRMQGLTFAEMLDQRFIEDYCLRRDAQWSRVSGKLTMRYEDLDDAQLERTVAQIAAYLELPLSPDTAARIARDHTRAAQMARIAKFDYEAHGIAVGRTRFDPETQLHNRHITSFARAHDWKPLTAPQIEIIEQMVGDWLVEHGYPLSTSPVTSPPLARSRAVEIPWALGRLPQTGLILDASEPHPAHQALIPTPNRWLETIYPPGTVAAPVTAAHHAQPLIGCTLSAGRYDAVVGIDLLGRIGMIPHSPRPIPAADRLALAEIRRLLKPTGFAVLTLPLGCGEVTPTGKRYRLDEVRRLFAGWEIDLVVWRDDGREYRLSDDQITATGDGVLGVVARPR